MSLLPSCREVSRLLSEALDSGRPLGMHVRIHLGICDVCRRVLAQFAVLKHGAARAPEEGPSLSSEAKARLRRFLGAP
ncbi:MAG: zf-HC2 domain-containing protein [Elusimicrobiota bacterium]|nr:zf-HC2 domain-containing protein [Elusimicrobiota bacterium]